MFIMCGVLYAINSVTEPHAQVYMYAYDLIADSIISLEVSGCLMCIIIRTFAYKCEVNGHIGSRYHAYQNVNFIYGIYNLLL